MVTMYADSSMNKNLSKHSRNLSTIDHTQIGAPNKVHLKQFKEMNTAYPFRQRLLNQSLQNDDGDQNARLSDLLPEGEDDYLPIK